MYACAKFVTSPAVVRRIKYFWSLMCWRRATMLVSVVSWLQLNVLLTCWRKVSNHLWEGEWEIPVSWPQNSAAHSVPQRLASLFWSQGHSSLGIMLFITVWVCGIATSADPPASQAWRTEFHMSTLLGRMVFYWWATWPMKGFQSSLKAD